MSDPELRKSTLNINAIVSTFKEDLQVKKTQKSPYRKRRFFTREHCSYSYSAIYVGFFQKKAIGLFTSKSGVPYKFPSRSPFERQDTSSCR